MSLKSIISQRLNSYNTKPPHTQVPDNFLSSLLGTSLINTKNEFVGCVPYYRVTCLTACGTPHLNIKHYFHVRNNHRQTLALLHISQSSRDYPGCSLCIPASAINLSRAYSKKWMLAKNIERSLSA